MTKKEIIKLIEKYWAELPMSFIHEFEEMENISSIDLKTQVENEILAILEDQIINEINFMQNNFSIAEIAKEVLIQYYLNTN